MLLSFFLHHPSVPTPGFSSLAPVLGAAVFIKYANSSLRVCRVLSSSILSFLGKMSFSLYLWHFPLLAFSSYFFPNMEWTHLLGLLLALFIFAYLTWRFIEEPCRVPNKISLHKLLLCLGVSVGFLFVFGISGVVKKGFPDRFNGPIKEVLTYQQYESSGMMLHDVCFLAPSIVWERIPNECLPSSRQYSVIVWGDSHGAFLMYGMREFNIPLGQITAASCPPIMDVSTRRNSLCAKVSEQALTSIIEAEPAVVVLHANWLLHAQTGVDLTKIRNTLSKLKNNLPFSQIIVVGGVPQWQPNLPTLVARHVLASKAIDSEIRIHQNSTSFLKRLDAIIRLEAEAAGYEFFSPLDALCDDVGCLAGRKVDGVLRLMSFDRSHLTREGSRILSEELQKMIPK